MKAALADARSCGVGSVICLGDVVGYGPESAEAVELCRKECDVVLMGNHDAAVAGEIGTDNFIPFAQNGVNRHRTELSGDQLEWLRKLPLQYATRNFLCVHGTLNRPECFFYMQDMVQVANSLSIMAERRRRLLFVGHTHHACYIVCSREKRKIEAFDAGKGLTLGPKELYIVNVGSVGYPRADHKITYVLYDSTARTVEFRRLPFDHAEYARRLEARGVALPIWLSDYIRTHLQGNQNRNNQEKR